MSKMIIFLVFFFLLGETYSRHLTKNQVKENNFHIMMASKSQTERNLLQVETQVSQVLQITELKYIGILIHGMGMRIVGMQNLLIWQIVHLYQKSQQEEIERYFDIGDFINGYSNPDIFTVKSFGYGYLFSKINLMWEVGFVLFCIGVIGRFVLGIWFRNKAMDELGIKVSLEKQKVFVQYKQQNNLTEGQLVSNSFNPNHPSQQLLNKHLHIENQLKESSKNCKLSVTDEKKTKSQKIKQSKESFHHKDSLIKSKIMGASLQTCDGSNIRIKLSNVKITQSKLIQQENISQIDLKNNQETKVQCEVQQNKEKQKGNIKNQNLQQNHDLNQKPISSQKLKQNFRIHRFIEKYSNILLKEIVFNVLINSLAVSSYGVIRQVMYPFSNEQQPNTLSFSGGFIVITQVIMLLVTMSLVMRKQVGDGENRGKFKVMSYGNLFYWSASILQRIIYGCTLGSGWKYSIIIVFSFKFCVLLLSKFMNVWKSSNHYYRYLCQNFIHLLIVLILVLDQFYLRVNNRFDISKVWIAWILLSLLIVSFFLNFCFLVKQSGIFELVKMFFNFGSSIVQENQQIREIDSVLQENNLQNQSTKRVKFNAKYDVINSKTSKNSLKSQQNLINSQKNTSSSLQIHKIKSKIKNLNFKSQSAIKIKTRHSLDHKMDKFYQKTQKNLNIEIDDALRAKKTQHIVIQQTKQIEQHDEDDAQIVSIQFNKENQ